jgi:hypothetical protein
LLGYWIAIAAVIVIAVLSYSALHGSVDNAQGVTHTLRLVEQQNRCDQSNQQQRPGHHPHTQPLRHWTAATNR